MKKSTSVILIAITVISIVACSKKSRTTNGSVNLVNLNALADSTYGLDSPFIEVDTANKMISSYLTSINSSDHSDEVRSFIVDAQALRYYLQNTDIKKVKIMLAHNLDYINGGGQNIYSGNNYNAVTVVIAGYDQNSNYVYSPAGLVIDHATPCPYDCPGSGTAASDLLPQ